MACWRQQGRLSVKYAIVDGLRQESAPGLRGTCPICDASVTPKCGKIRVAHWAHPPGIFDHRWAPETKWHRNWKERFPVEWQEVIHRAVNGERHIADVKTGYGRVIEFQNSPIAEEERRSREEFYRPMCWVVNGLRLKHDRRLFFESLRCGTIERVSHLTLVVPVERCVLLQKWADSRVHTFFDFGEIEQASDMFRFGAPVLWASHPRSPKGMAVVTPVYRKVFLESRIKGEPLKGIDFSKAFERALRPSVPRSIPVPPHPRKPRPLSFQQYLARQRRARSRNRL